MTTEEAYRAGYQAGTLSVPEIVRCKDCEKRPDKHQTELDGELYRYCELHRRWTTDNWFCADGKMKEGVHE